MADTTNTTPVSRRKLLRGSAMVAAISALPEVALAAGADAELLAKCAEFWRLLDRSEVAHGKWAKAREVAEADPACPDFFRRKYKSRKAHRAALAAWEAFMDAHVPHDLIKGCHVACMAVGTTLRDIFQTPAVTAAGILAKAKILERAKDSDYFESTDSLNCYEGEEGEPSWFASVLADLTSLTGQQGGAA